MEVGRLEREGRARVLGDPMLAVDRDAPRQVRRRAVQLLVEEVAQAPAACIDEDAGRHDVRPAPERHLVERRQGDDAIVPVMNPPNMPSPLYGGRTILIGSDA